MRILNVIASIDPVFGGPIEGALKLSDYWRESGHVADFATLDAPEASYINLCKGRVAALGKFGGTVSSRAPLKFSDRFGYSPLFVPWLKDNAQNYDAIVVHSHWNYATIAASHVLPGGKTPFFAFPHGCLDPWFKQAYPMKHLAKIVIWPFTEGRLANHANSVLFTSHEEMRLAQNAYLPWKIRGDVVPYGSKDVTGDPEQQKRAFRSLVPALKDRPFFLFLSRIDRKKGCDLLIRSFAKIASRFNKYDLVMAGPDHSGWVSELRGLAQDLGVANRVHWVGMVKGDAKWGAYHECEAKVLTSHTENFGIVVAEALARSKPVLITDKVNIWREVADAGAGLVEPDTQAGADKLLERFLAMPREDRELMGERGRICFDTHFRIDAAADKMIDVFRARGALG